jgi:chromosomal replication initiation ATPase DnaA
MGPDALQCGRVSLKALQMAILATFNCDEARFNSRSRARELVFARAVFVYLARTITHPQPSFPEIVRYISCGKSHSTAVTAYQRLQQRLTTDPLEIPPELSFTNNTRSLAEIVGGVEEFAKELTSLSLMKIFGKR